MGVVKIIMGYSPEQDYIGEWADDEKAHRIGFYLIPGFSMIAFVAAVEPLRLANLVSGKTVYSWYTMAHTKDSVYATNSLSVNIAQTVDEVPLLETIFVCGGENIRPNKKNVLFNLGAFIDL